MVGKVRDRKKLMNLYKIPSAVKYPKYILVAVKNRERRVNAEFIKEGSNLILKIGKKLTHLKKYDIVIFYQ